MEPIPWWDSLRLIGKNMSHRILSCSGWTNRLQNPIFSPSLIIPFSNSLWAWPDGMNVSSGFFSFKYPAEIWNSITIIRSLLNSVCFKKRPKVFVSCCLFHVFFFARKLFPHLGQAYSIAFPRFFAVFAQCEQNTVAQLGHIASSSVLVEHVGHLFFSVSISLWTPSISFSSEPISFSRSSVPPSDSVNAPRSKSSLSGFFSTGFFLGSLLPNNSWTLVVGAGCGGWGAAG